VTPGTVGDKPRTLAATYVWPGTLPDGTPFSEVVETYTSDVLAFPQPQWR
jgi:hypothetical protein